MTGQTKKPWTVMIYMAAEDPELYDYAKENLKQIFGFGCKGTTYISVQLDGGHHGEAHRYSCEKGDSSPIDPDPPVKDLERLERLTDFMNWSADNYPSDRYALILWGHGDGIDHLWKHGGFSLQRIEGKTTLSLADLARECSERSEFEEAVRSLLRTAGFLHFTDYNHYMKDSELPKALKTFKDTKNNGKDIDLLGFDACLMGMAEICYEIRDCVSFAVASAETIPPQSWPYDKILGGLAENPDMTPQDLSNFMVDKYIERYPEETEPVCLASFCLASCPPLAEAMVRLVEALKPFRRDASKRDQIRAARDAAQVYSWPEYIDLYIFCTNLATGLLVDDDTRGAAQRVVNILDYSFVTSYSYSTGKKLEGSMGLSIFFPLKLDSEALKTTLQRWASKRNLMLPGALLRRGGFEGGEWKGEVRWNDYKELGFCVRTKWDEFLRAFLRYGSRNHNRG